MHLRRTWSSAWTQHLYAYCVYRPLNDFLISQAYVGWYSPYCSVKRPVLFCSPTIGSTCSVFSKVFMFDHSRVIVWERSSVHPCYMGAHGHYINPLPDGSRRASPYHSIIVFSGKHHDCLTWIHIVVKAVDHQSYHESSYTFILFAYVTCIMQSLL
jgi:hypothetical protein